jgi:hypothetical protein
MQFDHLDPAPERAEGHPEPPIRRLDNGRVNRIEVFGRRGADHDALLLPRSGFERLLVARPMADTLLPNDETE